MVNKISVKEILKKSVVVIVLVVLMAGVGYGQDDKDVKIGKDQLLSLGNSLYNYSDPNKVNIIVNVWGAVGHPGKYLVPEGTTFLDIVTLCAPLINAQFENIRLLKPKNDSLGRKQDTIVNLNLQELFFEEKLTKKDVKNFVMQPGDVVIFQNGPTPWYFRDYLAVGFSALSLIVTVANLIVTMNK